MAQMSHKKWPLNNPIKFYKQYKFQLQCKMILYIYIYSLYYKHDNISDTNIIRSRVFPKPFTVTSSLSCKMS